MKDFDIKNSVAPIYTLNDARLIDALSGDSYLENLFIGDGPFIGGPGCSWMPFIKFRISGIADTVGGQSETVGGVEYYTKKGTTIFRTAKEFVAAVVEQKEANVGLPVPYTGSVASAVFEANNTAYITTPVHDLHTWDREGLADFIIDLNIILAQLK